MIALKLEGIAVRFSGLAAPALDLPALRIGAGERVAIAGPSGSGKTTLAHVLTGLERPAKGRVRWGDVDITALSEARRDRWRAENVGLVMQDFHLFAGLSALDNVLLPARLRSVRLDRSLAKRAADLLARVGVPVARRGIETLSRGEMQRVALARALLRAPALLVADEPTASLDAEGGAVVAALLVDLAMADGATLIVVSHDERLLARMDRRIDIAAGRIVQDSQKALPLRSGP